MTSSILVTKLFIPPFLPNLVPRPRLVERLNQGVDRKLTLISAPAGFGKTTMLSEWVHQSSIPVAWLSLDKGDNDPISFLVYLVAALNTIEAGHFDSIQIMLKAPQPPPLESIIKEIINEVAAVSKPFFLVLDDYHVIEDHLIHDAITFLLEHLPPVMHLVIASRSDPLIKTPRLRAHDQMTELRADDLRFSTQEATNYLNKVMGLPLSEEDVSALESRTEGWIAGLHLAALSMRGRMQSGEDAVTFISAFTGDDRYIVDYLIDEVLSQRPSGTQDFLLQTSILDRMNGSLCDKVTGQEGGQKVLEMFEQSNLFIVPLDNRRKWYRYHHLFADLLRQRFEESTTPEKVKLLHQRASFWYEENEFLIEAVDHALAAEDYKNVIRLIEQGSTEILMRSQQNLLLKWQAELPQQLVTSQPKLCILLTWAWVATGHPKEAEHCLQVIEQTLGTEMEALFSENEGTNALDSNTRSALVEIAVIRAELAIERGDIPEALKLSNLVLSNLDDEQGAYFYHPPKESRMVILFIMGLAHKIRGELSLADSALTEAAALGQELANVHIVAGAYGRRANIQNTLGHLILGIQTFHQGLPLVQELIGERSPLSGLIHAELGNLLYEQNNLDAALHHLQRGIDLAKPWNLLEAFVSGYTGLARVRAAEGDWDGAFAALDKLADLGESNPALVMTAVASFRTKLWIAKGQANKAFEFASDNDLFSDGDISNSRMEEHMVLARLLISKGAYVQAIDLIDRMLAIAEALEWFGLVIEMRILLSITRRSQGETEEALKLLEPALNYAKAEGYVRVFLNEGQPIESMLREVKAMGIAPDYVRKLLVEFETDQIQFYPPIDTVLNESLSDRELEVLRLLKTELSGPEIADELTIALSTMRTHTQNIYGKLGVDNRRAAVRRAEELNLQ